MSLLTLGSSTTAKHASTGRSTGCRVFPVLATFVHEAVGQARTMCGDPEAHESFQAAMEAAEASGLDARRDALMAYMRKV